MREARVDHRRVGEVNRSQRKTALIRGSKPGIRDRKTLEHTKRSLGYTNKEREGRLGNPEIGPRASKAGTTTRPTERTQGRRE